MAQRRSGGNSQGLWTRGQERERCRWKGAKVVEAFVCVFFGGCYSYTVGLKFLEVFLLLVLVDDLSFPFLFWGMFEVITLTWGGLRWWFDRACFCDVAKETFLATPAVGTLECFWTKPGWSWSWKICLFWLICKKCGESQRVRTKRLQLTWQYDWWKRCNAESSGQVQQHPVQSAVWKLLLSKELSFQRLQPIIHRVK